MERSLRQRDLRTTSFVGERNFSSEESQTLAEAMATGEWVSARRGDGVKELSSEALASPL